MEPLLTIEDARLFFGFKSVRSVYELVENRDPAVRLACVRIGNRIRFTQQGLNAYAEDHTQWRHPAEEAALEARAKEAAAEKITSPKKAPVKARTRVKAAAK